MLTLQEAGTEVPVSLPRRRWLNPDHASHRLSGLDGLPFAGHNTIAVAARDFGGTGYAIPSPRIVSLHQMNACVPERRFAHSASSDTFRPMP